MCTHSILFLFESILELKKSFSILLKQSFKIHKFANTPKTGNNEQKQTQR
jgi:hypothetical protein